MWKTWHSITRAGEKLIIRPAYPSDAAAFVETLDEVAKEGIYLLDEHASRTVAEQERIIQLLDWSRNLIAVAVLDNKIIGGMGILSEGCLPRHKHFAIWVFILSGVPDQKGSAQS